MGVEGMLDVVVRFHDHSRLGELERALFSVVGQSYRPINVVLVLQRFADEQARDVADVLEKVLGDEDGITHDLLRWNAAEPLDGRSALINKGLRACKGRYLAFLDYDDTLFPEAYGLLVEALTAADAGIAFASLRMLRVDTYEHFVYGQRTSANFEGSSLRNLFQTNFCPIHSFALDRAKIPDEFLYFDVSLKVEEDYDFLLRICSNFRSDFSLIGTQIGDYVLKNDGSNSTPVDSWSVDFTNSYRDTVSLMNARRRLTTLSPAVMAAEGIGAERPISIAAFLDGDYTLLPS